MAQSEYETLDETTIKAISVVLDANKASVGLIQRRLGVSYKEAAEIINNLGELGVITKYTGEKPSAVNREVIERYKIINLNPEKSPYTFSPEFLQLEQSLENVSKSKVPETLKSTLGQKLLNDAELSELEEIAIRRKFRDKLFLMPTHEAPPAKQPTDSQIKQAEALAADGNELSVSYLQKQLGVGYGTASMILDKLRTEKDNELQTVPTIRKSTFSQNILSIMVILLVAIVPLGYIGFQFWQDSQKEAEEKLAIEQLNAPTPYQASDFKVTFPCSDIYQDEPLGKNDPDLYGRHYSCFTTEPKNVNYSVHITEYRTSTYGSAESEAKDCEDSTDETSGEKFVKIYQEVRTIQGSGTYYICDLENIDTGRNYMTASRFVGNTIYKVGVSASGEDSKNLNDDFQKFFNTFQLLR